MSKKSLLLILFVLGIVFFVGSSWAGDGGTYVKTMKNFTERADSACWFCGIYRTLLDAIDSLAYTVVHSMSSIFIKLLSLLLFGYLLWKVGKAVVSFSPINPVEFTKDLLMPFLRAGVVIVVLQPAVMEQFFQEIVSPVAEMALGFATEIHEKGLFAGGITSFKTIQASAGSVPEIHVGCDLTEGTSQMISTTFKNSIICFIKTVSLSLINFMAVGATFIGDCWFKVWRIFPDFTMLCVGLAYLVGTFVIFLSFPFKLLDSIIQLMFVLSLMPLWVVLWVLPATRDKSQKALGIFLGILINFIAFSIILIMVIKVLISSFDGLGDAAAQQKFFEYLITDHSKDALNMVDWSKTGFWMTVAMFFLANALLGKAESFSGQFGGVGSMGVAGTAGQMFTKLGQKVGDVTVKPLATRGAEKIGTGLGYVGKGLAAGTKWSASKTFQGGAYLAGATARAFSNAANNAAETGFNTSTGVIPQRGTSGSGYSSVETSGPVETSLPGNKKKVKTSSTFRDAAGKKTHENEKEIVTDAHGHVESEKLTRTSFDKNGKKKQEFEVEIKKQLGKVVSKVSRLKDENGNIKAELRRTNDEVQKTSYENGVKSQEKAVKTKRNNAGQVESKTTTQIIYEADGKTEKQRKVIEEKLDPNTQKVISSTETVVDGKKKPISKMEKTSEGIKTTTYTERGHTVEEKKGGITTLTEFEGNKRKSVKITSPSGSKTVEFGDFDQEKKITETDKNGTNITENTFGLGNKKIASTVTHLGSDNRKKWSEKEDTSGTTRIEFDDQEREKIVTAKSIDGRMTTTTNTYNAEGNRSGFTTKIVNKKNEELEHFTVNLETGMKIDHLSGDKESPYKP